jgi:hypothetical protein
MFGKVKKILGIEGVKLELIIPEEASKDAGIITGFIKLTALSDDNLLQSIQIQLIEKYSRGRGDSKLINEYTMGDVTKEEDIKISKNDVIEIPFELDFVFVKSEMDKMEESNIFSRALVKLAKKAKGVQSEYSVRAEAKIKGTTLSPMDQKSIKLI